LYAKWTKNYDELSDKWFSKVSSITTDASKVKVIKFEFATEIPTGYDGQINVGLTYEDEIYLSYKADGGMFEFIIWSKETIFAPNTSSYLFSDSNKSDGENYFSSLTEIKFNNFNTSTVIDMNGMFDGCCSLKSIDLSMFDLRNIQSNSIQVFSSDCALDRIIAPYTTGENNIEISLPSSYYILGDASVLYTSMSSSNATFSTESESTILVIAGINKTVNVSINDEDLIITLTSNGLNKVVDISSTSVVLKTGSWTISSDAVLTTSQLKGIFEKTYTGYKVEIKEILANNWVVVVSETV
jgi:surface protein